MRVVLNATEDEVLDRLDEAVDAGLLTTVPGASGRFRFAHDLVESFYAALTPAGASGYIDRSPRASRVSTAPTGTRT